MSFSNYRSQRRDAHRRTEKKDTNDKEQKTQRRKKENRERASVRKEKGEKEKKHRGKNTGNKERHREENQPHIRLHPFISKPKVIKRKQERVWKTEQRNKKKKTSRNRETGRK